MGVVWRASGGLRKACARRSCTWVVLIAGLVERQNSIGAAYLVQHHASEFSGFPRVRYLTKAGSPCTRAKPPRITRSMSSKCQIPDNNRLDAFASDIADGGQDELRCVATRQRCRPSSRLSTVWQIFIRLRPFPSDLSTKVGETSL